MKSAFLRLFGLAVLTALAGCHSAHMGNKTLLDSARALRTRSDVLNTLGGPVAVTEQDGNQALTYRYTRMRGSGLGVGDWGIGLFVSDKHFGSDIVTFVIGPDGRVISQQVGQHFTAHLYPGLWPF